MSHSTHALCRRRSCKPSIRKLFEARLRGRASNDLAVVSKIAAAVQVERRNRLAGEVLVARNDRTTGGNEPPQIGNPSNTPSYAAKLLTRALSGGR